MRGKTLRAVKTPKPIKDQSYLMALDAYWRNDFELSKAILTTRMSHEISKDLEFALYRLWIEVLLKESDYSSLRLLQEHLEKISLASDDDSVIYQSLSLLIYTELDEMEMAKVYLKTIKRSSSNCYLNECLLILEHRQTDSLDKRLLRSFCKGFYDYIQLERAIGFSYIYAHTKLCDEIKLFIMSGYKQSPLPAVVDFFQSLEDGQIQKANQIAIDIYEKFPSNKEFQLNAAASSYMNQDFVKAIELLKQSIEASPGYDLVSIYSRSLLQLNQLSESSIEPSYLSEVIEKTNGICQKELRVPTYSAENLAYLNDNMLNETKENSQRYWLVEIKAREFYRIRTSPTELKLIRKPLGSGIAKGDVCIFVCEDKLFSDAQGSKAYRLCAIYTVESDPQWHPIHRYESILRKEFQPSVAIPLVIDALGDKNTQTSFAMGDKRRYGVVKIRDEDLDKIEEQVAEFIDDFDVYPTSIMPFHKAQ